MLGDLRVWDYHGPGTLEELEEVANGAMDPVEMIEITCKPWTHGTQWDLKLREEFGMIKIEWS